jgi:hypothetical protein
LGIPSHIPEVCAVCSVSTVCRETIFLDIKGVGGGASHLRLCGGTAVSRANAEILASEQDSKTRYTFN